MSSISYKDLVAKTGKQSQSGTIKPKKIVFVLPSLVAGGAERVLISLMNGLDRKKYAPEMIVLNDSGPLRDWIAPDIPYHPLGNYSVKNSLWKLLKTLNTIQPDVIMSTMAHMNYAVLLIRPFLKKKARVIVREACTPQSIIDDQRHKTIVKSAYKSLYPTADMVISPASLIIEEFEKNLKMDTSNHALLHNPVHIDRIRREETFLQKVDEDRSNTVNFICAGRLHYQKGFDRLIQSLPKLSSNQNWHLTILGVGKERENLEQLIRQYGFDDKVSMPGLSRNPWPHIGAADAFLLPSRWEGLPNVVLESLSVGTPVISMHEAGGIAEIARLSEPGAVKVASTMDEFINYMEEVRPMPSSFYRPSLLPGYFEYDAVMQRFQDLIDNRPIPMRAPAKPISKAQNNIVRPAFGRRKRAA